MQHWRQGRKNKKLQGRKNMNEPAGKAQGRKGEIMEEAHSGYTVVQRLSIGALELG